MQPRSIAVPPPTGARPLSRWSGKLEARGKFFFSGAEKLLLKGITYGPFAPDGCGTQFPDRDTVKSDLALIAELGANTLRTFTVPPRWRLDLAARRDLRVLVGIPWAEHVCFLDSAEVVRSIRRTIAEAVEGCRDHPAVAAYLVGTRSRRTSSGGTAPGGSPLCPRLRCGPSDKGRFCHVLRAPSRAAATPQTVHDACAPFTVSGRWLAGGRRALAMGTGLLSLGLGLYLAFQIGFVDGLFLGAPVWIPR